MVREEYLLNAIAARGDLGKRHQDEAEQVMATTPLDISELKYLHSLLEEDIKTISGLFGKLRHLHSTSGRSDRDAVTQDYDTEERTLRSLRIMVDTVAGRLQKKTEPERYTSRGLLPSLKIEAFQGEMGKFRPFIDSFEASIDSRTDIMAADKLQLLKSYLKGPPLTLVESFRATAENYRSAVQALKDRYGNQQRYELSLCGELAELEAPDHNLKSLSHYHSRYESLLRSLENVGCDLKANEFIIVRQLKYRLNQETWNVMRSVCDMEKNDLQEFRNSFNRLLTDMESSPGASRAQRNSQNNHDQEKKKPSSDSSGSKPKQKGHWRKQDVGNYHVSSKGDEKSATKEKAGGASHSPSSSAHQCLLCSDTHSMYTCTKYPSVEKRQQRASELKRCRKCFRQHATSDCNTNLWKCRKCNQGRHHVLFCPGDSRDSTRNSDTQATPVISTVDSGGEVNNGAIPTAEAVVGGSSKRLDTRVFFDLGAQRTFISSELVSQLNIKSAGTAELTIDGFTGPWPRKSFEVVNVVVSIGDKSRNVNAIVVDRLPQGTYTEGVGNIVRYLKNKGLKMADNTLTEKAIPRIGVLMGADYSMEYFKQFSMVDNIHLIETSGGHAVVGQLPLDIAQGQTAVSSIVVADVGVGYNPLPSRTTSLDMEKFIPQLWELESIGIQEEKYTPEESSAYSAYYESVVYENSQYWVKLPWKLDRGHLPTNYHVAKHRLQSTLKKLKQNPNHVKLYSEIIEEQEKKGFIERVGDARVTPATHYLPHLAVVKDSKTTPIRIVFDCSARQDHKSNSLNDCLYSGPSLTEKLGKVLLKFRTNPFAFAADISKAFLRVGLQEEDRDYTRFLWPENPLNPESSFITYRFRSVLFGATSSPFLLQATLTHHLDKSESQYADKIKDSLYVDNLQGTMSNESDIIDFYHTVNHTMAEANMPLQSWCTNSQELQKVVSIEQNDDQKLLGITWNVKGDTLNISEVSFESGPLTKRKLLSNLSRVFDPLGLLSPLTVPARVLMQEVWKLRLDWDSMLPETIQEQWNAITLKLKGLSQISFPRETCREGTAYDLHVFCDASQKAYGAVAYVTDGVQKPHLVMSKVKVAPVKTKTLPQLELTALYVGVKLQQYIRDTMSSIQFKEIYLWGDSEVALCQVKNNNSKKVYVRNRVTVINEIGSHCIIQHVSGAQNPADLLTRGRSVENLKKEQHWFHGPAWLNDKGSWPVQKAFAVTQCPIVDANTQSNRAEIFDGKRYSSLKKLLGVTKQVFRFVNICKKEEIVKESPINYWLKWVQEAEYAEEIKYIKENVGKVPELVKKLGLFLDEGFLRCKGRIDNSELSYSARFPFLLPKKHWFTKLVIEEYHQRALHGGVQDTLCKLREHYWVPQGRQSVKSVISKCYVCRRLEGPHCDYPSPPPLPSYRTDNGVPFLTTGVDYTGALNIMDSDTGDSRKVYVVLFTCANTRAVHLELAVDLTADTFLNVFRRFVARRSCPQIMISDNGRYFQLSSSLLRQIMENARVKRELEERGCRWKFIPPKSPWQGGFYERLIGVIKGCLKKTLFKKRVSIEDLYTIVAEVENRVNNRPLTYVSDDINELEALTPSHLICGRRLKSIPLVTHTLEEDDPSYLDHEGLNERYSNLSKIINKWQVLWKREYLTSLREKFYGMSPSQNLKRTLKAGDIVIVQGLGPRAEWPLGRVEETYPDEEGAVRMVKVKTKTGVFLRTVEKLFPLECEVEAEVPAESSDVSEDVLGQPKDGERPSRKAAVKFRDRLRNLIDSGELT